VNEKVLLLVLLALPLVASPAVVLREALASPEVAVCLTLFSTATSFLLETVVFDLWVTVTWLLESGPVLLIVASVSVEADAP